MDRAVAIRTEILKRINAHAHSDPSRECCGLLAGRDEVITDAYPALNMASDPARGYEIAPQQVVRLMREFRERALEFLGIYHSHPRGENEPSRRDIEQAYYSEAVYFILSPRPEAAQPIRAFSIREGQAYELSIKTVA